MRSGVIRSFLLVILMCFQIYLYSKEIKYKVSDIPIELKVNARSAIRLYEREFKLINIGQAVLKTKIAITILNENGIYDSKFEEYYDKFSKISNIQGYVYNEAGEKIKNIKLEDINDYSAISGFELYSDDRVKVIDPEVRTFPFTVEYSFETTYKGLFQYPFYNPVIDYNISVISSSFILKVPDGFSFRYFEQNITSPFQISKESGYTNYTWSLNNIQAYKKESYSLSKMRYFPVVFFAPNDFEIGDYRGNANTWLNFGKWNYELKSGMNNLSDETSAKIKELVQFASDDLGKVQLIYNYLQEKTRYISIQAGIGGWQPIDAATVDRLSYGDCKALANYMVSLLEKAGVKSYYTLVSAGKNAPEILDEFPSNQFNHIIVCVPIEKDTLWLECTSQIIPCGYLGSFTDDRDVLIIHEDGGHLAHTPIYNLDENVLVSSATVQIKDDGKSFAEVRNKYKGVYFDEMVPIIHSDDNDKKRIMYEKIPLSNFLIKSFSHNEEKSRFPSIIEDMNLELNNYCTKMGNNVILPITFLNRLENSPKKSDVRKSDILIQRSTTEIDSVTFILPENYEITTLPQDVIITSKYGEFRYRVYAQDKKIIYLRLFKLFKGIFPKSDYPDFINFFNKIEEIENTKVVLKRII